MSIAVGTVSTSGSATANDQDGTVRSCPVAKVPRRMDGTLVCSARYYCAKFHAPWDVQPVVHGRLYCVSKRTIVRLALACTLGTRASTRPRCPTSKRLRPPPAKKARLPKYLPPSRVVRVCDDAPLPRKYAAKNTYLRSVSFISAMHPPSKQCLPDR